jgi:hypothetical protein
LSITAPDARHSWLDALSSAGALAGLVAVSLGFRLGDPIAGMAVTLFICHVGYEVTKDVVQRLADGIDPAVITTAEEAAGSVDGVIHAHARARWTGRTLRVEIEGWFDPDLTVTDTDAIGQQIALAADCPREGTHGFWSGIEESAAPGAASARGGQQGASDQLRRAGGAVAGCAQLGGVRTFASGSAGMTDRTVRAHARVAPKSELCT